jgi:hypothetical protein
MEAMQMAISMKVSGEKLIIEVDVGQKAIKSASPSSTGKTRIVASTNGFSNVDGLEKDRVRVNLTVTVPNKTSGE